MKKILKKLFLCFFFGNIFCINIFSKDNYILSIGGFIYKDGNKINNTDIKIDKGDENPEEYTSNEEGYYAYNNTSVPINNGATFNFFNDMDLNINDKIMRVVELEKEDNYHFGTVKDCPNVNFVANLSQSMHCRYDIMLNTPFIKQIQGRKGSNTIKVKFSERVQKLGGGIWKV